MEKTIPQNHVLKYGRRNDLVAVSMHQDNRGHIANRKSSIQPRWEGITFVFLPTDKI